MHKMTALYSTRAQRKQSGGCNEYPASTGFELSTTDREGSTHSSPCGSNCAVPVCYFVTLFQSLTE